MSLCIALEIKKVINKRLHLLWAASVCVGDLDPIEALLEHGPGDPGWG